MGGIAQNGGMNIVADMSDNGAYVTGDFNIRINTAKIQDDAENIQLGLSAAGAWALKYIIEPMQIPKSNLQNNNAFPNVSQDDILLPGVSPNYGEGMEGEMNPIVPPPVFPSVIVPVF